ADESIVAEPRAVPPPTAETGRRRTGLLVALTAAVVLAGAGAYLALVDPGFLVEEDAVAGVEPEAERPITLEAARAFLETAPAADEAAAEAKRFAENDQLDAAFLLNSYAARGGDPEAALAIGDAYNPETWTGGVLKAPDADRAVEFYRVAAESGVVEAMEKLGALLGGGEVSAPDGPEQAAFWLRKAREAGAKEPSE
ncbi:MAG: hypothetical protein AAGF90_21570, partial [Pseudomonadota bacterium]